MIVTKLQNANDVPVRQEDGWSAARGILFGVVGGVAIWSLLALAAVAIWG